MIIKNYISLFRIPQWIKNLFVFVPLLFSRHLFDLEYLFIVLGGFVIFCLTSSVVYIINDIIDSEADKYHPVKKNRPVASGEITQKSAAIAAFVLFLIVLFSLQYFEFLFSLSAAVYLLLNVFYSFWFKHVVLLDIFSIAAGFMIRVVAGAFIINVEISSWLILTTMFLSLYLAVMKRRSELVVVKDEPNTVTRKVLAFYSFNFTDQMATVAAAGVIISYALYSVSSRTIAVFGTENLIYTTPFVVFGIFRYMYLVYISEKGENATEIMITDLPMLINTMLYLLTTTLILYKII